MRNINVILFATTLLGIRLTDMQAQTVKDTDDNLYNTETIGTQVWIHRPAGTVLMF
jgi:hypothetical protein